MKITQGDHIYVAQTGQITVLGEDLKPIGEIVLQDFDPFSSFIDDHIDAEGNLLAVSQPNQIRVYKDLKPLSHIEAQGIAHVWKGNILVFGASSLQVFNPGGQLLKTHPIAGFTVPALAKGEDGVYFLHGSKEISVLQTDLKVVPLEASFDQSLQPWSMQLSKQKYLIVNYLDYGLDVFYLASPTAAGPDNGAVHTRSATLIVRADAPCYWKLLGQENILAIDQDNTAKLLELQGAITVWKLSPSKWHNVTEDALVKATFKIPESFEVALIKHTLIGVNQQGIWSQSVAAMTTNTPTQ